MILMVFRARLSRRCSVLRLVRVFGWGTGTGGLGGRAGAATGVSAGQAAAAGGPQAASNRLVHAVWRCQPSGRCTVMWPRPWREMRAAMAIS